MAAEIKNTRSVWTEDSTVVSGTGVERLVLNGYAADIYEFMPIVNIGWDDTYGCMKVRKTLDPSDRVMGVSLTFISGSSLSRCRYITNGIIGGMNTSDWEVGDSLYATSFGTFVNYRFTKATDEYEVIPQEVAKVERVHLTAGEINVVLTSASTAMPYEPGFRCDGGIEVSSGEVKEITFSRAFIEAPTRVMIDVVDETGMQIGSDVLRDTIAKDKFSVRIGTGGTGVHLLSYEAKLKV